MSREAGQVGLTLNEVVARIQGVRQGLAMYDWIIRRDKVIIARVGKPSTYIGVSVAFAIASYLLLGSFIGLLAAPIGGLMGSILGLRLINRRRTRILTLNEKELIELDSTNQVIPFASIKNVRLQFSKRGGTLTLDWNSSFKSVRIPGRRAADNLHGILSKYLGDKLISTNNG